MTEASKRKGLPPAVNWTLRIAGFVILAIVLSAVAPFLAIQQTLLFFVLLAVFLYFFSRSFSRRANH
ncbi:MAG TPA: hypothetical protein VHN99_01920 [Deinococcales bacterium]|nr:hypothetical protein [Deinococcales bacterium]